SRNIHPHGRGGFLSNLAWQGTGAVLLALRGLVGLAIVAKLLGADGYGLYSQFMATLTLIAPVLTLYVDAGLVRYLAGEADGRTVSGQYFAALVLVLLESLIAAYVIGSIAPSQVSLWIWGDTGYVTYARWLALALVPAACNLVALALYQARREFRYTVGVQVGKSAAQLVVAYAAAVVGYGVLGVAIGIAATELVFLLLMLAMAVGTVGRPHFDFGSLPRLLRYSLPLLPTHLGLWLMTTGGRYVMVHYLSLQEVGVFAASFTLGSVAGLFINPITYVLLPTASAEWRAGRAKEAIGFIDYASRLFLALAIPSSIGLVVLAEPLLRAVTTERFIAGAMLVLPAAIGTVAMGLFRINNTWLLLRERTKQVALMLLVGLGMNLCLTLLAVPRIGAAGAAWAFAVSYSAIALWNVVACRRSEHRVPLRALAVFGVKAMAAAAAMTGVILSVLAALPAARMLSIVAAIAIGGMTYLVGLWAMRAYDPQDLAQLRGIVRRLTRLV
ncbi:MAG: oligosaccharide flippase family protein, partial [Anaerolineae bacterium]|nr:oligosaccharide flippase family protein [Anaerolineae bacterium]